MRKQYWKCEIWLTWGSFKMHHTIYHQNYPMTLIHILYNLMQVYLHIRDKTSIHSWRLLYDWLEIWHLTFFWWPKLFHSQKVGDKFSNQAVKKAQDFTTSLKSKALICVKLTWPLAHYVLQRGHCLWRGAVGWEAAWKRLNKSLSSREPWKKQTMSWK